MTNVQINENVAIPVELFLAIFEGLDLPTRMRAAANVLNDAGTEFHRRPENERAARGSHSKN